MRLISGPPGSGKSHLILEEVRAALAHGSTDFRLLVPTATMAEHLRNQMAREGFLLRPNLISTLSRFVSEWVDAPEISAVQLELIIEQVLARACPPEFSAVAERRGFRELLVRLIDELSSGGHDSRRLAKALGDRPADAPLAPPFLSVFEEVEKELCLQRGISRATRLRRAADEIRSRGLGRIRSVFFDGFFTLSHPELYLVHAIRSHADVTVALPSWPGAAPAYEALTAMGLQEQELQPAVHRFPLRQILAAPSPGHEVEEIARRILEHVAAGRQFRDIGIVLRSRSPYAPVLRSVLERYGIPARFYFATPLASHGVVRYLTGAVEAMLAGWDHELLLPLLKMAASGFGCTSACDRFDFAVREQLPGHGLAALRSLSDHPRLHVLIDRLCAIEPWAAARALPADWAFRVRGLRSLVQMPAVVDEVSFDIAEIWRSEAHALDAFAAAADEAAEALPAGEPTPFAAYWRLFNSVLDHTDMRMPDRRRNVVHVMDVFEARQWELAVVFVCGLIEKEFPVYDSADPIFPDAARVRLQLAGVRLNTADDHRRQEDFLFDVATSRATSELVLTYPANDEKGDPNLPSFFLARFGLESEPCAPRPAVPAAAPSARPEYIQDSDLLAALTARHETVRPSAIEAFLQCPFRFFLAHTLGLDGAPPLPRERLNALVEGTIVHQALSEWHRTGESLDRIFEQTFREICERERVPAGCAAELARIRMLRDLRRYLARTRRLEGWKTATEEEIQFDLDENVAIRGRIDRYDTGPDGRAVVFDYKYTRAEGIRRRIRGYEQGRYVQGALYLLGLEKRYGLVPAGLFYCGLKKNVTLDGWHTSLPGFEGAACTAEVLRELLDAARSATLGAAAEIRKGRVEPWPANREECEYCEFLDVCRIGPPAEAVAAEGAAE